MRALLRSLDPRRSLSRAIGWLVFALSLGLVLVAYLWVGDIVLNSMLGQRARQLDNTANRLAAELNLNLALRLQSVRAAAALLATELGHDNVSAIRRVLANLQQASPEFAWIGVQDRQGRLLAATGAALPGAWPAPGVWRADHDHVQFVPVGDAATDGAGRRAAPLAQVLAPVRDAGGATVGAIGAQLQRAWLLALADRLGAELRAQSGMELRLLERDGSVLSGPAIPPGPRGADRAAPAPGGADTVDLPGAGADPAGERRRALLAQATPVASDALHLLGWRVQVLQPLQDVRRAARALQAQIGAVLLGLGLISTLIGVQLARRVTRGLDAIAASADRVLLDNTASIVVPGGQNEAARLGRALDNMLGSLQRERGALQALTAELDQRIAARTREVERLAEQARYAAVARERLKIARDLHDTLAHSMMAMLTEIRLLKRLARVNPGALADELEHAEDTAHQGLREARAALTQMRFNPVRDAGLAAALADFLRQFSARSGIDVRYRCDADTATLSDEQAETLFRIAEEAMRNIESHAGASQASLALDGAHANGARNAEGDGRTITLTIADNGAGFDTGAAHPGHYGLRGLREQAQLIGASLSISSGPQSGTRIVVRLDSAT